MKIIWRMITERESLWKKTLATKYLNQIKTKLLTDIIPMRPCTQVWKLVKKIIPSIKNHISKTPRNRKSMSIWDDRIMGKEPLNFQWYLLGMGICSVAACYHTIETDTEQRPIWQKEDALSLI